MPSETGGATGPRRHHRGVVALVVVAAAVITSCAPSVQDTRSTADLGVPVANRLTEPLPTTTASPAPAAPAPAAPAPTAPAAPPSAGPTGPVASIAGCPLTTPDHVLRARADAMPVRAGSAAAIAAAGATMPVRPLFSSTVWEGSRRGFPVNVLDGSTAPRRTLVLSSAFGPTSDNGIPWSSDLRFEGWPIRAWDRRLVVLDSDSCEFWEAINLQSPSENIFAFLANTWYADKVVRWDPGAPAPRARGSISGSGLPFLPGLVRYDEVASGRIDHALLVTLPTISSGAPVWPATRNDGRNPDPAAPRMGSWLRLRADVDLSRLGPQARVVAAALQRHGMILSDTSPHLGLRGEPDLRWNDADLVGLEQLTLDDFEFVDPSGIKVSDGTWSTR